LGDDTVYGFLTWELFSRKWQKSQASKYYLCSVVVELEGTPVTDELCHGCSNAWDLSTTIIESDCPETTQENELFTSITGLALGAVPDEIQADMPIAGITAGSYLSYDNEEWQPHGWAMEPNTATGWTGGESLDLWPAFTWDLDSL
jgi:hypothetical protein